MTICLVDGLNWGEKGRGVALAVFLAARMGHCAFI